MTSKKKHFAVASAVALLSFAANFSIFVFSYSRLAFPFLTEEQRVENADFIMSAIVGEFAAVAIAIGVAFYWTLSFSRRA